MNQQEHWNQVYQTKGESDRSWYQQRPNLSLELIGTSGIGREEGIIDVGGGTSNLVDFLLEEGYRNLAVLDISGAALGQLRERLGTRAGDVEWFESDVTSFQPTRAFGLWHDRAVFHFLTKPEDRRAYIDTLRKTLNPGGTVVISTFSLEGPLKCSGLEVMRHDEKSLMAEFGPEFILKDVRHETHKTPWDSGQRFIYLRLQWQK